MTQKLLQAPEHIDEHTGSTLYEEARRQHVRANEALVLDLHGARTIDPKGGAWVVAIANYATGNGADFACEGQSDSVAEFIKLIEPGFAASPRPAKKTEGFFEGIGEQTFKYGGEFWEFMNLIVDAIYWTLIAPLEGRGFRWGLWIDEMYEMGVRAVRINCMMNFLLGLIIAMLSGAQLHRYGLDIYVADLMMISFARELAAIMTAVVVSARTGAAIAAELATMKVQEEIDALRGMGLNVAQFLVAPKVLALLIVMPCLVVLGIISGILGGAVWGVFVLNVRPDVWFAETQHIAAFSDLFQGMLKTLVFAVMIVLVGCHNGLRVRGGSRGVGQMTTRAVVMDIFFIIVIDIIFATIFYYILGNPGKAV